jgi:hypothetical protein
VSDLNERKAVRTLAAATEKASAQHRRRGGRNNSKLEHVVPWGRSKAEYVKMFALTGEEDLSGKILDCAGELASFKAGTTRDGRSVVSCDLLYCFSAEDIPRRIEETYGGVMRSVRESAESFVWKDVGSPERLGEVRTTAMRRFLDDFPAGLREGRYVASELPEPPFESNRFDLALCSHLLFTYSVQFSEEFHLASVLEMCRVAREVRVLPLLASSVHGDMGAGEKSPHLCPVVDELRRRGYGARVERLPYESQKGGDEMLRILDLREPRTENPKRLSYQRMGLPER